MLPQINLDDYDDIDLNNYEEIPVTQPEQPKSAFKRFTDWATSPIFDVNLPAGAQNGLVEGAKNAVKALPDIGRNIIHDPWSTIEGFVSGAKEGAKSVATPVNIAGAVLPMARGIAAGAKLPAIADALALTNRGVNAGIAAEGAYNVATKPNFSDKAMGLSELILGAHGMKAPKISTSALEAEIEAARTKAKSVPDPFADRSDPVSQPIDPFADTRPRNVDYDLMNDQYILGQADDVVNPLPERKMLPAKGETIDLTNYEPIPDSSFVRASNIKELPAKGESSFKEPTRFIANDSGNIADTTVNDPSELANSKFKKPGTTIPEFERSTTPKQAIQARESLFDQFLADETGELRLDEIFKRTPEQRRTATVQKVAQLDAAKAKDVKYRDLLPENLRGELIPGETYRARLINELGKPAKEQGAFTSSRQTPGTRVVPQGAIGRLTEALQDTLDNKPEQESLFRRERGKRAEAYRNVETTGEAGFKERLGKLKGELPKVSFEPIKIAQRDVDAMIDVIRNSKLREYEQARASIGLQKLLGRVPDERAPQTSEIRLLKEVFGDKEIEQILELHAGIGMLPHPNSMSVTGVNNFLKGASASGEISPVWRQASGLIYRPEYWKNLPSLIKGIGSDEFATQSHNEIKGRSNFKSMTDAGIKIHGNEKATLQGEVEMGSPLVNRVPVIRQLNRGVTTFLDKTRADIFDALKDKLNKAGLKGDEVDKRIVKFVNTQSGTGRLPKLGQYDLEKASSELNFLLFSPRYKAAQIRLFDPRSYLSEKNAGLRQEYWKSLAGRAAAIGAADLVYNALGGKINTDPTNSDFGKSRIGDTRFDPNNGYSQLLVAMARILSGQSTAPSTGQTSVFNSGYGSKSAGDVLVNMARSASSPIVGFLGDWAFGKNLAGEDFDLTNEAKSKLIMMAWQDLYDVAKANPGLIPLSAFSGFLGIGQQTFPDRKPNTAAKPVFKQPKQSTLKEQMGF